MNVYIPIGAIYLLGVLVALYFAVEIVFPLYCLSVEVLSPRLWWRKLWGGK